MKSLEKVLKDKNLSIYSKIIFAFLWSKCGNNNSFREKSLVLIKDLNISERTFSKHIKILEKLGYITIERKMFSPNLYIIKEKNKVYFYPAKILYKK